MNSIIEAVVENLKRELEDFFKELPTVSDVEQYAMTRLKETALQLTACYAEETDRILYEDKAGRKVAGLVLERRKDQRSLLTMCGELTYSRSYYQLRDGTYSHPIDELLEVGKYQRISRETTEALAKEAAEGSYEKAGKVVTGGAVSRQTVMKAVRSCEAKKEAVSEVRRVKVLHIDADEDHVSLQNGKTRIVPLISVYEGLEEIGGKKRKRHQCREVFHYSEEKYSEDFWDNAVNEIERRYDLTDTVVYLHGDGAQWIKQGKENFKECRHVLDGYHKNKAKKAFFAGVKKGECLSEKSGLNRAFITGDQSLLLDIWRKRMEQNPEYGESITEAMNYLYNNLEGISIRYQDREARNGGGTEPHVSHVLSSRLSSRPMGWSDKTLKHLVPILASRSGVQLIEKAADKTIPEIVLSAAKVMTGRKLPNLRRAPAIVAPDSRYRTEVINNGQLNQLYRTIRGLSR